MKISELKEKRDVFLTKVKQLEEQISAKKKALNDLEKELWGEKTVRRNIERLEFRISTEAMNLKTEREFAKVMEKLEVELKGIEKKKAGKEDLEEEAYYLEQALDACEADLFEIRGELNEANEEQKRAREEELRRREEQERLRQEREREKDIEQKIPRQKSKEQEIFLGDIVVIKKKNGEEQAKDLKEREF